MNEDVVFIGVSLCSPRQAEDFGLRRCRTTQGNVIADGVAIYFG
jgi:hypothetical protein